MKLSPCLGRLVAMLALLVAAMAGTPAASVAAAQPDAGVYESPLTGAVVEATEPWRIDADTQKAPDADIIRLSGPAGHLVIGFLPATVDFEAAQARALERVAGDLQGYSALESGSYDDVTYALALAQLDGTEVGLFSVLQETDDPAFDEIAVYLAPVSAFAEGMDVLQQSVTVDDVPVFDGVESAGLQAVLDANAGTVESGPAQDTPAETDADKPSDDVGTAEATQEAAAEDADTVDGRDARRLPTEGETPEAANESETGRGAGARIDEPQSEPDATDLEALGLVEEGEYVSPQFDTEVLWDPSWELDRAADEPLVSDAERGMDSLVLIWNGEDFVLLYVDLFAAEGLTPEDFAIYWTSDEYLEENADPDAEILLDDSDDASGAVLMRDYLSDGEEVIILREALSLDGGDTIALVTLIGFPETFPDAYADAREGITIDGDAAVQTFTPLRIERAI